MCYLLALLFSVRDATQADLETQAFIRTISGIAFYYGLPQSPPRPRNRVVLAGRQSLRSGIIHINISGQSAKSYRRKRTSRNLATPVQSRFRTACSIPIGWNQ